MDPKSSDYYIKKVEELIDGIDKGDFSGEVIPDKYRWEHLWGVFLLRDTLDGGEELFKKLYDMVIKSAINYVRNKRRRGEKIRVFFQSYSAAIWPAESVYQRLKNTPGIEVSVVVSPIIDRDKESSLDTYRESEKWFVENGYNVIKGMNIETGEASTWEDFGDYPDVIYQLSVWFTSMPPELWFSKLPLRCLTAYIPYCLDFPDGTYSEGRIQSLLNKEIVNMMWRVYCESQVDLEEFQKYQLLRGKNVRYSGYPKMDYLYNRRNWTNDELIKIWKIPDGCNAETMKKVIIAPHFSVFNIGLLSMSTFHKNAYFLLYLAEKYKDEVSFIFKPHPNLRYSAVVSHLFSSYEDYDKYIERWNSLPNAKAVSEQSYLEIFATSDGMIMDSCSFLAEYLYVDKPLLFLTRPEQNMPEKFTSAHYRVPGDDYCRIEGFLRTVVIGGNDTMSEDRKRVFEEFDYLSNTGMLAGDYICDDLLREIDNENYCKN